MFCIEEKTTSMSKTELHFDAVIVGLGKTGLSCVRHFSKQGLSIAVTDSRMEPPGLVQLKHEFPTVPVYPGEIEQDLLLVADQIILSPGISLEHKAVKQAINQGIPVYGDIELFCQQAKAPIIAITGSNGKSTVTTLVAEILKDADIKTSVGGNLGTPALDLLDEPIPELYVLELSSFQLETTFSLNTKASVVLNVSPDHMDRYSDMESYALAKQKIYSGNGLMVINLDDEIVKAMTDHSRNIKTFSVISAKADFHIAEYEGEVWLCHDEEKLIKQSELGIKGEHNVANALAAMALVSSMNVSEISMATTLKRFTGLPHRCQWVANINGVNFYNDSKATNVGASIAAIKGLCTQGRIILIAGGDSKGADLSGLITVVRDYVKTVFLLGIDAEKIAEVIKPYVNCEFVKDMDEAVKSANAIAEKGEIILLAPACASLDMYENYQHRGEAFVAAVEALEVC